MQNNIAEWLSIFLEIYIIQKNMISFDSVHFHYTKFTLALETILSKTFFKKHLKTLGWFGNPCHFRAHTKHGAS